MERKQATIPSFTQATTYFKNHGKMLNDSDVSALKFFLETEIKNSTKFASTVVVGNHKIYCNKETGKYFTILKPISGQNTEKAFTDIVFQLKNAVKNNSLLQGRDICIYAPMCNGSLDSPQHWVNCFATFKANEPSAKVVVEVDNSTGQKHPETGKRRQTDNWSCGIHTMEAIYGRVYNNFPYKSTESLNFDTTKIEQTINNKLDGLEGMGFITQEEKELLIQNSSKNLSTLDSFLDSLLGLKTRETITLENRINGYLSRIDELDSNNSEKQRGYINQIIQRINTTRTQQKFEQKKPKSLVSQQPLTQKNQTKIEQTNPKIIFNDNCEFLEKEQADTLRDLLQEKEENIKQFNKFFENFREDGELTLSLYIEKFIADFLKKQEQTTEEKNTIQEFCFSNNSQTVSKNLDCAKKEIDNLTSCCLLI